MKLPIRIVLELTKFVDDEAFYELTVIVPEVEASKTIAHVRSDASGTAEITDIERNGLSEIEERSRLELLLCFFKLALHEMRENDGSAIEWWISDVRKLLQNVFGCIEAAGLIRSLSEFVDSDREVQDMTVVRID